MKTITCFFICAHALYGCTEPQTPALASFGWLFSYQDWTDSDSTQDFRTCDNVKKNSLDPAYSSISDIHVSLEDSKGLVQGFNSAYGCDYAYNKTNARISGIVPQMYHLNIQAKNAAGTTLYFYDDPNFNIGTPQQTVFTLQAATGETAFYLNYPDTTFPQCPLNAQTIAYTVTQLDASNNTTQTTVTGTQQACENNQAARVFIREIPVAPYRGANGSFINVMQKIQITVKNNQGTVLYQGTENRVIRPGNNSMNPSFVVQKETFPPTQDTTTTP
jgi:hypothetical protein